MEKVIVYEKVHGKPFIIRSNEVNPAIHVTSIFDITHPDVDMIRGELERLKRDVTADEWYKRFVQPYRDLHQRFYSIVRRIRENKSLDRKKKRRPCQGERHE